VKLDYLTTATAIPTLKRQHSNSNSTIKNSNRDNNIKETRQSAVTENIATQI